MSKNRIVIFLLLLCAFNGALSAQDVMVSEKQDVAVFALGYYGFDIPESIIANVDAEILGVFVNLGRFNVLGQTERFSAKDVQEFIDLIENAKRNNTPLPEDVRFGEVQLTEALMRKLFGAFVVVIPTIVDFRMEREGNDYQTYIKTSVAFLNVAEGNTIGMANISTMGTSKESRSKATQMAISSIPFQLSFEVRKIDAFTLRTKALQVGFNSIKMQLGRDMGVEVGDEFVVVERFEIAGLVDEEEDGLVVITNVGPQISTAQILYSGPTLRPGAQLREVPRMGVELMPYLQTLTYFEPVIGWKLGSDEEEEETTDTIALGIRAAITQGFFALRPIVGVQINFDTKLWLPIIAYGGVEYNFRIRRFALT